MFRPISHLTFLNHFVSILSFIFDLIGAVFFFLFLDNVEPLFFQSFTSSWVHFFHRSLEATTKRLVKYPYGV